MTIEKCRYYNDHQTACCLMIDDLVPAAVSLDGKIGPYNDWGYLKDGKNSQYQYLEDSLFSKYPEIRGTIFLPIEAHNHIPRDSGYQVFTSDFDDDYIRFLQKIGQRFEFAFHGLKHTWKDSKTGATVFEYANSSREYNVTTMQKVKTFSEKTGIAFTGGKFPGYKYNAAAKDLLIALKTKWWALDSDMLQKRSTKNKIITDNNSKISYIPTNVSGDCFNQGKREDAIKEIVKKIFQNRFYKEPIRFLQYLYENGLPMTIQEHYHNQGTSGKRQKPNIYDDLDSLDKIFNFLRNLDVWHASCGQLAQYFDSYLNTNILKSGKNGFELIYGGIWENPGISVKTDVKMLYNIGQNKNISGVKRNGMWVYNDLIPGKYMIGTNGI